MENSERYTDKLAKYILLAAGIGIIGTICWYFSNVLIYILLAVVVSLIGQPIMSVLRKIRIKVRPKSSFTTWTIFINNSCIYFYIILCILLRFASNYGTPILIIFIIHFSYRPL